MAEAHIDHPGEITWFAGKGPLPVVGPCPHDCKHFGMSTVAWGPDYDHYTLAQCEDSSGCNGFCRGWTMEYPSPLRDGPKYRLHSMMQVAAAGSETPHQPQNGEPN